MAKTSTLTPSQAAAVLNVSPSTLRRWSAEFAEHLSEAARGAPGRHRSYTPEDVATLQRAGELLKTLSPGEVNQRLGLAAESHQAAALATLPAIAGELQSARDLITHLRGEVAALHQANQDQAAALADLRAADVLMRGEIGRALARQAKRSKAQEAELADLRAEIEALKARRHWWQRFTRR